MKQSHKYLSTALVIALAASASAFADDKNAEAELQDMQDPLAVFTSVGIGYTDRGFNFKYGEAYDTGDENTMGMNVIELMGFAGEHTGFSQTVDPDNSIDAFRLRNFEVDLITGRGAMTDMKYDVERESLSTSYSLLQAMPKWGLVQLYPLAGVGVNIKNNAFEYGDNQVEQGSGYSIEGTYATVGLFSKVDITDKFWFNYNPTYVSTLSGSDYYKDNAYGKDNSDLFLHEIAISYQLSLRSTVRYFANFSDEVNYKNGEHRIEFNYQL